MHVRLTFLSTSVGALLASLNVPLSLPLWCVAGYDSEGDGGCGVSSGGEEEQKEEEEEEEEGEGEEEKRKEEGRSEGREGGDVWSYNLMTESPSSHSSGNVLTVDRDTRGSSEPHDMKHFSDESSSTKATDTTEKRRNSRALLERLRLVRRSKSPGEYKETSDGGEVKKAVLRGEQTSSSDKQLAVFGRDGNVEGERGGSGVAEPDGEEDDTESKGKEQSEDVDRDNPTFTLALISRRSRHRAGETDIFLVTLYAVCVTLCYLFLHQVLGIAGGEWTH